LLSFGEEYPEEQLKGRIVALGSEVHLNGAVPYVAALSGGDGHRTLRLLFTISDFLDSDRFLAVRIK
jgi:hypothetical protein